MTCQKPPKYVKTFLAAQSFFGKTPHLQTWRHQSLLASLSIHINNMMQFRKKKILSHKLPAPLGTGKRHFLRPRNYHKQNGSCWSDIPGLVLPVFYQAGKPQTCRAMFSAQQRWRTDTQQDTGWAGQLAMETHLLVHPFTRDTPVSAKWEGNQRSLLFSGACREALWEGCTPSPVTQGS